MTAIVLQDFAVAFQQAADSPRVAAQSLASGAAIESGAGSRLLQIACDARAYEAGVPTETFVKWPVIRKASATVFGTVTRRDLHEVTYAVVELEDACDELRGVALGTFGQGSTTSAALRERLKVGTQAVQGALERLADVQARLERHAPAPGLPVAESARYLGVSEPTVRVWLARGVLDRVPGAKPVVVETASLRRAGHALAELRDRGRDRDWTRALVDVLHDRVDRAHPELVDGLAELRLGKLEPA